MVFLALHRLQASGTVRYLHFLNDCDSDKNPSVAGHTILPSIISGLKGINDTSNPVKLVYQAISYKPFISLFNITGVESANPQLAGIGIFFIYQARSETYCLSKNVVNYAAAVALEVRQPTSGGEPILRFNFKNGTDDPDFITYKFFNSTNTDIPLSNFINAMEVTLFLCLPQAIHLIWYPALGHQYNVAVVRSLWKHSRPRMWCSQSRCRLRCSLRANQSCRGRVFGRRVDYRSHPCYVRDPLVLGCS